MANREPSTSSKEEESTEDAVASSLSMQKGTLMDRFVCMIVDTDLVESWEHSGSFECSM